MGGRVTNGVVDEGSSKVRGPIDDDVTFSEFRQIVLDAHIARKRSQGKPFFDEVPEEELEEIEEGYRMRRAAAIKCRELLAAARAALAKAKDDGDAKAKNTRSIGVCSAYRDFAYDRSKWFETFKKRYDMMVEGGKFAGNPHGKPAQRFMLHDMLPLKAPPGFSNHSNGTAVDFKTSFGGKMYVADSLQLESWTGTWLYKWLKDNAGTFEFLPLASEPWHWDHE